MGKIILGKNVRVTSAPLPNEIVPCLVQPTTHYLRSFGILNKGYISVGASVENAHVGRGQSIKLSIASRNDASVDIDRVQVKLVELIEYHADKESQTHKVELHKLKDVDLPCVFKEKRKRSEVRQSMRDMSTNIEATYTAIYQDLVSGENQVLVTIPEHARDSYDGKLMKISHYLKVMFFTKALVENPSSKIPIQIGSPPVPSQEGGQPRIVGAPVATAVEQEHVVGPTGTVPPSERESVEVVAGNEIPMANAVLVDQQGNPIQEQPEPSAPTEAILIGANAVFIDDRNFGPPMPPPPIHLPQLFAELDASIANDFEIVSTKLEYPGWAALFTLLTSDEFGTIIAHVKMDYQIRVATLLAGQIRKEQDFTCAYCAAAVKNASEYFRSNMVEAILPYVVDLVTNNRLIRDQLSDWERVISERAFEDAIILAMI
jgi:hypothetical protein